MVGAGRHRHRRDQLHHAFHSGRNQPTDPRGDRPRPGVGKTHLAIRLAIAVAEAGRRVYYGTLTGLINTLMADAPSAPGPCGPRGVSLGHGVDRVPETRRLNVRPLAHPPGGARPLKVSEIPGRRNVGRRG